MGNRPSIFTWTPQEHLEYQWQYRPKLSCEPAPKHVRVYLFPEWKEGHSDKDLIRDWLFLKGDFPLESSGDLSLARVRRTWGLEKCAAIDPNRRKMFVGSNPDYLSPLAVGLLTDENGILKLFEPQPSDDILNIRKERMKVVREYQAIMSWVEDRYYDVTGNVWTWIFMIIVILYVLLTLLWKVEYYLRNPEEWLVPIMLPRSW